MTRAMQKNGGSPTEVPRIALTWTPSKKLKPLYEAIDAKINWIVRRRLRGNTRFANMNPSERIAHVAKIVTEMILEMQAQSIAERLQEDKLVKLSINKRAGSFLRILSRDLESEPRPILNKTETATIFLHETRCQFRVRGRAVNFAALSDEEARAAISRAISAILGSNNQDLSLGEVRTMRRRNAKISKGDRFFYFRALTDEIQRQLVSHLVKREISLDYYRKVRRQIGRA